MTAITAECATQGAVLQERAARLQHGRQRVMRRFGRQGRGMGTVFVTLVRQTEAHGLELGAEVLPLAQAAHTGLHRAPQLSDEPQRRLDTQLAGALEAHRRIARQSRRLTQGVSDDVKIPLCDG